MIQLKTLLEQGELDVMQKPALFYNLNSNKALIQLYKQIEIKLQDQFTEAHFKAESAMSGPLKPEANGVNVSALKALKALQTQYPAVRLFRNDKIASYRDYTTQADLFIRVASQRGGTIDKAMQRAALPGFSQHHTGKAFDISGYNTITDDILKQFGFQRPYLKASKWRISEPWHIYYEK